MDEGARSGPDNLHINVGLAGVNMPHVDQLWVRLQKTFLPTTTAEKYGLEHEFGNLQQGTLTFKEYAYLIQEKSNELKALGIAPARDRIMSLLLNSLTNVNLRAYLHTLSPTTPMEEIFIALRM